MTQGWGVGIHEYRLVRPADWNSAARDGEQITFCVSHNEHVSQPAPHSKIIAGSDFCPYAVTTIGRNILTIQAHPEVDRGFARVLYDHRRERIGDAATDAALQSLEKPTNDAEFVQMALQFVRSRIGASRDKVA